MVRIPTHRPPTHPGEMLLEDFWLNLQRHWEMYHALREDLAQVARHLG